MVVPDLDQARDLTAELWAAINPSKLKAAPFQSVNSPFWFAAEGVVVGFLIGYAATRVGGEGPATVGA